MTIDNITSTTQRHFGVVGKFQLHGDSITAAQRK